MTTELERITYAACERVECAWKGAEMDEDPENSSEAHLQASDHRRRTGHHTLVVHNVRDGAK